MTVTLKHFTPLHIASEAIRTCWQSQDNSDTYYEYEDNGGKALTPTCGPKDKELIERVANKFRHASTIEHLNYNFQIEGISRACLQEVARHRHTSLSVKSSRYTLKELKDEKSFMIPDIHGAMHFYPHMKRASKYLVLTNNFDVDDASVRALDALRSLVATGVSNDIAKYCMPESFKTELAWSINARSLQNFLSLRTNKAALWEIRDLANAIYEQLPEDHKFLFKDCIQGVTDDNS